MKTFFSFFCLLIFSVFFCCDASGSTRKTSREQDSLNNSARRQENFAMDEIHNIQMRLLKKQNKIKERQRKKLQDRIVRHQQTLAPAISQIRNFPFPNEMLTMEKVVADIQSGKIKFPGTAAKKPEKILRDIQIQQRRLLENYQRERSRRSSQRDR